MVDILLNIDTATMIVNITYRIDFHVEFRSMIGSMIIVVTIGMHVCMVRILIYLYIILERSLHNRWLILVDSHYNMNEK
jgi:hypothetical protein